MEATSFPEPFETNALYVDLGPLVTKASLSWDELSRSPPYLYSTLSDYDTFGDLAQVVSKYEDHLVLCRCIAEAKQLWVHIAMLDDFCLQIGITHSYSHDNLLKAAKTQIRQKVSTENIMVITKRLRKFRSAQWELEEYEGHDHLKKVLVVQSNLATIEMLTAQKALH